jgi:hypothetical protein
MFFSIHNPLALGVARVSGGGIPVPILNADCNFHGLMAMNVRDNNYQQPLMMGSSVAGSTKRF